MNMSEKYDISAIELPEFTILNFDKSPFSLFFLLDIWYDKVSYSCLWYVFFCRCYWLWSVFFVTVLDFDKCLAFVTLLHFEKSSFSPCLTLISLLYLWYWLWSLSLFFAFISLLCFCSWLLSVFFPLSL